MSTIGYYICVPFAWLVRLFYNLTNSYGVALILFTLVIKLIMLPFQMKSKKSMMRMSRVSGQMQELQKRYAKNQAKLQEEMQKLYEEEGVNPMSGCLSSFYTALHCGSGCVGARLGCFADSGRLFCGLHTFLGALQVIVLPVAESLLFFRHDGSPLF